MNECIVAPKLRLVREHFWKSHPKPDSNWKDTSHPFLQYQAIRPREHSHPKLDCNLKETSQCQYFESFLVSIRSMNISQTHIQSPIWQDFPSRAISIQFWPTTYFDQSVFCESVCLKAYFVRVSHWEREKYSVFLIFFSGTGFQGFHLWFEDGAQFNQHTNILHNTRRR